MTLINENWAQFRTLVHSDWSMHEKKRWSAIARQTKLGWRVDGINLFSEISDLLFGQRDHSILAGFDFPIGMPNFWYERAGVSNFLSFIDKVRSGEFPHFFNVSNTISEISSARPFYPNSSGKKGDKKRHHLLSQLNVCDSSHLFRECEIAKGNRPAASPLFWTIGAKQVGKAALSGWEEVVMPLIDKDAILWPFQSFQLTEKSKSLVLVETYPAEYYDFFEVGLMKRRSKRRQDHRIEAGSKMLSWLEGRNVSIASNLKTKIIDGFGFSEDGEDPFDAVVGLCGMLDVVLGNRPPSSKLSSFHLDREGWIFGQS
jgi:hypothetical protein